ncbi:glycosyltransferase [Candidatus Pantoea multigeneris]|uniref:Glycosyltransferase n=1 Tax=Candidatus Pantoea multigeneris TaxID=2608357 RepID=A0ABX0R7E9_9GAMM|nr:glycosyltransferase [Pantoea multigeneris]NIF21308.1 glycosyltransferase [Pantoea multigeneris]
MNFLLTIVVPVYNPGALLKPFLESLRQQTLLSREIILVDDGCTDGSAELLNAFAQQHVDVLVINQRRQGVSCARNAGIKMARGKYIAFPDADDQLLPEMYATLVAQAEENQLNAVQCNGVRVYSPEHNKQIFPDHCFRNTEVMSGASWLQMALSSRRYLHVVWLGIYRLDNLRDWQLMFEPGLHHQDIPWTTEFMLLAPRVQYRHEILYQQTMHAQSISHRSRQGIENVEYQRHYMKIVAMLVQLNQQYYAQTRSRPALNWQLTREALSICHCARREPVIEARQQIASAFFQHGLHKEIWKNCRGVKQRWQVILWLYRMRCYRKLL